MPPSPFPGMDPYLEQPHAWKNVHDRLIINLSDALNEMLPRGYATSIGERVYVEEPDRSIYPDVVVAQERETGKTATAGVTVLEPEADAAWVLPESPNVVHESFLEVLSLQTGRRVVTLIEILSPANKRKRSAGRRDYLTKQEEVLDARVNLLELDLLRAGEHTVVATLEELTPLGKWTYLVCLSEAARRGACTVWPIGLRDPLPRVRVPLAPGDTPLVIALQPLLERAYAAGRFERLIDYTAEPPSPPLTEEDRVWVAERVQAASAGN